MGKPTRWARPQQHYNAAFGFTFDGNLTSNVIMDNMNTGDTLIRCIASVEVFVRFNVVSALDMDASGWWHDIQVTFGLYIPNLKTGWAATPPDPRLNSSDDHWIWNEPLYPYIVHEQLNDQWVSAGWRFPTGRIDVTTNQGPATAGGGNQVTACWNVSGNTTGYFNTHTGSKDSHGGAHISLQNLYTTA